MKLIPAMTFRADIAELIPAIVGSFNRMAQCATRRTLAGWFGFLLAYAFVVVRNFSDELVGGANLAAVLTLM